MNPYQLNTILEGVPDPLRHLYDKLQNILPQELTSTRDHRPVYNPPHPDSYLIATIHPKGSSTFIASVIFQDGQLLINPTDPDLYNHHLGPFAKWSQLQTSLKHLGAKWTATHQHQQRNKTTLDAAWAKPKTKQYKLSYTTVTHGADNEQTWHAYQYQGNNIKATAYVDQDGTTTVTARGLINTGRGHTYASTAHQIHLPGLRSAIEQLNYHIGTSPTHRTPENLIYHKALLALHQILTGSPTTPPEPDLYGPLEDAAGTNLNPAGTGQLNGELETDYGPTILSIKLGDPILIVATLKSQRDINTNFLMKPRDLHPGSIKGKIENDFAQQLAKNG